MKPIDLIGQRFGKLVVIEKLPAIGGEGAYKCMCDCGNYRTALRQQLRFKKAWNCGCTRRNAKNLTRAALYDVWRGIKSRCYEPSAISYKRYGAKGVIMCNEWLNDFEIFHKWCLENKWEKGMQIDKDIIPKRLGIPALLYSPERCMVVSALENSRNASNLKLNMEKANEIRVSPLSNSKLAKMYGVSTTIVCQIKNNKRWAI